MKGNFYEGEDRRDEWPIKGVSVIPEIEWNPERVFADSVQIHPRTTRDRPKLFDVRGKTSEAADLSVLGMVAASLPIFVPDPNFVKEDKVPIDICDCFARVPQ